MDDYVIVEYQPGVYDIREGVRVCVAGLTLGQARNVYAELENLHQNTRHQMVLLVTKGL